MNLTECNWSDVTDIWGTTATRLWNDACPSISVITKHGKGTPEEAKDLYDKLDKKKKRRVLRVILYYKGKQFSQQREVRDDLFVTTDDMRLLIEKYGEWLKQREVKVTVDNVKVK